MFSEFLIKWHVYTDTSNIKCKYTSSCYQTIEKTVGTGKTYSNDTIELSISSTSPNIVTMTSKNMP
jgi:hypothetical protein